MGSVYIPTLAEMLMVAQSRGADSEAPGLWKGLVGDWPLAERGGVTAHDLSGYGNDGTLTNMDPATDWVVTEKGPALDFDGVDQYVNTVEFPIQTWTALTAACWCKPVAANDDYLFGQYNDGFKAGFFTKYNDFKQWMTFSVKTAAGAVSFDSPADSVPLNVWSHIVLRWDGINLSAYINGAPDGSAAAGAMDADVSGAVFRIGDLGGTNGAVTPWKGGISQTSLWPRALAPNEIQELYANPHAMHTLRWSRFFIRILAPPVGLGGGSSGQLAALGGRFESFRIDRSSPTARGLLALWGPGTPSGSKVFDYAGRGSHGTISGMDPSKDWMIDPERGWLLDFDGTDARVDTPNVTNNSAIPQTMMAWVKPDSISTADRGYVLTSNNVAEGVSSVLDINVLANGDIQWIILTTGTDIEAITAGSVMVAGEWQHIAATWGGTLGADIPVIYRNGQLIDNNYQASGSGSASASIGSWSMGGRISDNNRNIDGQISDARFYNRVISTAEINRIYRSTLVEPYGDLRLRPRKLFKAPAAPPAGAIMNQIQGANLGADLFDGTLAI